MLCPFGFTLGLHILFVENNAFKCATLLAIHCARQCWRLYMTHIMISEVMFIISFCLQFFRTSHSGWKHSLFHIALEKEVLKLRYSYPLNVLCSHQFFHGCGLSWTLLVEHYCFTHLLIVFYVGTGIWLSWSPNSSWINNALLYTLYILLYMYSSINSFIEYILLHWTMLHGTFWFLTKVSGLWFGLKSKVIKHSTRLLYLLTL